MTEFSATNQPGHDRSEAAKEAWTFKRTMRKVLSQEEVTVGVNDRVPLHERIVRAHIGKALDGDVPAIKEFYERVDGKVTDRHELSGPDGKPIQTEVVTNELDLARRVAALLEGAADKPL